MNEHSKHETSSDTPEDTDVLSLVQKIQKHLVFLEKKLDTLIAQSGQTSHRPSHSDRPFKKSFSKPFRPSFGHRGGGGGKPEYGNRSGGERDSSQGRPPFDRNRGRDNRGGGGGFGENKKPFFARRKDRG